MDYRLFLLESGDRPRGVGEIISATGLSDGTFEGINRAISWLWRREIGGMPILIESVVLLSPWPGDGGIGGIRNVPLASSNLRDVLKHPPRLARAAELCSESWGSYFDCRLLPIDPTPIESEDLWTGLMFDWLSRVSPSLSKFFSLAVDLVGLVEDTVPEKDCLDGISGCLPDSLPEQLLFAKFPRLWRLRFDPISLVSIEGATECPRTIKPFVWSSLDMRNCCSPTAEPAADKIKIEMRKESVHIFPEHGGKKREMGKEVSNHEDV